jgi:hypothetical protein
MAKPIFMTRSGPWRETRKIKNFPVIFPVLREFDPGLFWDETRSEQPIVDIAGQPPEDLRPWRFL